MRQPPWNGSAGHSSSRNKSRFRTGRDDRSRGAAPWIRRDRPQFGDATNRKQSLVVRAPGRVRDGRRCGCASPARQISWRAHRDTSRTTHPTARASTRHGISKDTCGGSGPTRWVHLKASPRSYPEIVYRRGADAVSWLERAFGFTATVQVPGPDGEPLHAEMRLGDSTIMLNLGGAQAAGPTQAISVRVGRSGRCLRARARGRAPSWCRPR